MSCDGIFDASKSTRAAVRTRISQLDPRIAFLVKSLEALPNEIISEIFINFLPPYPACTPLVGPLSPSFLCRICRRWRDVALSTPWLWCSMQLELEEQSLPQQLHILKTWLKRSGSCPISISLYRENDDPKISTSAFVKAMVRNSSRWADMHLILPYRELRLIKGDMPLLRKLNFGPTFNRTNEEHAFLAAPIAPFERAPNLRDVALSEVFNPFAIHLPWASITTLAAELCAGQTVENFRHAQDLVQCTITLGPSADPATFTMLPPLQHLTSLILREPICWRGGSSNVINLLNSLTLPALQTLEIDEMVLDDREASMPALISFTYPPPGEPTNYGGPRTANILPRTSGRLCITHICGTSSSGRRLPYGSPRATNLNVSFLATYMEVAHLPPTKYEGVGSYFCF
ncbi:hypothetical protein C8R43DRAFT_1239338 [Mycena crocata]|nr:hypothetical protein C8R43DRAFT_1239338 [Mycena crocata]